MTTFLRMARGALCLVGNHVDDLARIAIASEAPLDASIIFADAKSYHITVLTKAELRALPEDRVAALKADTRYVSSAGIGGGHGVFFVVVIWAAGQQLRKELGLAPKQFHITLSERDDHEMDKSVESLLPGQFPTCPSPQLLDHLAYTLHLSGQYQTSQHYSGMLIEIDSESHKGFLRLADSSILKNQSKLAMLCYACAHERTNDGKIKAYCMKKLTECSRESEWGTVLQNYEIPQIPGNISSILLAPWSPELWQTLANANISPSLCLEPRDILVVPLSSKSLGTCGYYKLPRFFRWLIPGYFAIMSTPRNEDDVSVLSSPHLGIRHILTLTEETPLKNSWFYGKSITNTYSPIPNYHPPSIEQMDLILDLFQDQNKLPLLVHCGGGKGRAGTVAACYIAAFGFQKLSFDRTQPEFPAAEAMALLRSLRPGSIETSQQEEFVSKWCSTIWKRQSIFPDRPTEPPPCTVVVEGSLSKENDLFVLMGLPGSGKSSFSKSLMARDPGGWNRISQDDSGSRLACEAEIGRKPSGRVLLDRCNTAASDRKGWLELASNWCTSPVCVWFDYDRDLCISRAQLRAGHPTLPPGNRVRNAVEQMSKIFTRPTLREGFKAIVIIRSFAAAQEFVLRLSPPITVYKFPRTPHLLDLGAATSDDIHADMSSLRIEGHVVITEKIDGANMGFSLSPDRSQIVVQNRSHYVNSSTHEQFKKLGLWVERHREELYQLLDRDPFFAERYILFGEWVFATHSIPYAHLPDYFIAYDLYDRATQTWEHTQGLRRLLSSTTISVVPVIHEGIPPTDDVLRAMVQSKSSFYDGRVEGVYVKVERDTRVAFRGKIVRDDFIAGNEHWTRGGLRVNGLDQKLKE